MLKRRFQSILIFVLLIALILPCWVMPVSAEYENTYKNTGNMRNDIIGVALTQVGYTEGSNNYTKYGVWYGLSNSPWCGMFVSWCAKEAGIPTSVLKRTGIANPSNFGLSYKSGSEYTPQKGDLFFKKNFSHVGFVYYTDGAYFYTIEGNTSTTTYDGTSVMIRRRKISDFYFSSPNYQGGSSTNTGCSHDYTTKVESDHPHKEYKICSKCDKKSYTGSNKSSDSCKTCIQEACDHEYSAWKKTSDSKHSRTCSKCDKTETQSHDWKKGDVLKEATCVDTGSQQIICSACNAESSKTIEATGEHTFGDFSYLDESAHQKVCSVCLLQTTSEHTITNSWKNDTLYHWTSCKDCGGRLKHTEHSYPGGCLTPCETCNYTTENGHKLTGEYEFDGSSHWQVCTKCQLDTEIQAHRYSTDCDAFCNDCGYQRDISVEHDDQYYSDETGHWQICNACGRETELVSHSPDTTAKEWESLFCTDCHFELRSSDRHEHFFHDIESDEHTHWGSCVCGEILEAEVHEWNIKTGTCSVCDAEYIEPDTQTKSGFLATIWREIWTFFCIR